MHLEKYNIPFSKTCLPSAYNNQFKKMIAKPREGRGSRGLLIDYKDYRTLNDHEYLIQEMNEGIEVTTAVYVSYLTNKLVGYINLNRKLDNGLTIQCEVINTFNEEIERLLIALLSKYSFKGAFNIQSIIDTNNKIHPFEINCRISGTNSIRHNLGFKDVQYTIDELLFQKTILKPTISDGFAIRYFADVIYPNGISNNNNSDNFILF
jgi:carbamoyl-phosphate synthase large subunit